MGSLTNNDNELYQNSISYLHNISNLTFNPPALKCLYLTKARLMELRRNIHVPSKITRTTVRCQRCFLNFIDGPATYAIKAEEKLSKFGRKMLMKVNKDKHLTKYQRMYTKRMNRFSGNQLVITCKFCKKETLVKLEKPKKDVSSKVVKKSLKRKKKIKKKDRFCGLNQNIVLSITPESAKKFYTSNFIPVETRSSMKPIRFNLNKKDNLIDSISERITPLVRNDRGPIRYKLSKKQNIEKNATEQIITKEDIRKNNNKFKNNSKLKEFLNTSTTNLIKSSHSTNLKHFLQSL